MFKKIVPVFIGFFVLLSSAAVAAVPEAVKECPLIAQELRPLVQRTIASKPEDLFVVLKNGLTLLVHQQPSAEVVSAQVFVRAGSALEGKYMRAGLSHYLEHVVSGGTTRSFTEEQAGERLRAMGGTTNAYTSYDRTVYYINTASEQWRNALDLLLSYVSENVLDPREVEREKPVIQQEMKMGESNPNVELWRLFIQTAYQLNPVRYPVIGYEEVFVNQSRDALLDYYQQRYQPENIIVALSGNVNGSEVLRFVADKTRTFLPRQSDPVVLPDEPSQGSMRWEEKEVPITRLVQAYIGFPSVNAYEKDGYALDVLAQLLGEGQTCRLHCRLKEEQNKVFSVGASNWTPAFVRGQFLISVSLAPDQWPGALKDIQEEIDLFKTGLVSLDDLQKAKKTAIARRVYEQGSVSSRASSLASSYLLTGNPYFGDEYVEGIRAVTAEEVRAVAQRYLVSDHMNVAVIKPPASEQVKTAEAVCPVVEPVPVEFSRMANGLRTLVKQDTSLPYVTMQLYGTGGLVLEDLDRPGLSALTASLLTAGTKTRAKLEMLRKIEDAGGVISATSDNNTYHVSIKVLKEDFGWAFDILADMARNSEFPPEEIEKLRQDTLTAIKRSDENWQSEIMRLFKKNYFRNASYKNDRLGTPESIGAVTRDDLRSFYRKMVNPAHSVLAVYGDVEPATVKTLIQEKFGSWSGKPVEKKLPEETRQIAENRTVEVKNEKNSAALFIGTNGVDINNADRPALDVLTAVLSGGGGPAGRMFEALRGGDRNLVYAVSCFPFYGKNAGYFGVITQTTMGNLPQVQDVIIANLKRLATEPVPQDELEKAKQSILVSLKLGRETIEGQASNAALNEVLGLGWDHGRQFAELVGKVDAESVRKLAARLFEHTLTARTLPERPVEILAAPPVMKNDAPM
ncbi:MAG: insulinase family protein [Desulfobacteraceae bacterium]|nr:insulinase family protein [Desulfobacteraceae bacterium]